MWWQVQPVFLANPSVVSYSRHDYRPADTSTQMVEPSEVTSQWAKSIFYNYNSSWPLGLCQAATRQSTIFAWVCRCHLSVLVLWHGEAIRSNLECLGSSDRTLLPCQTHAMRGPHALCVESVRYFSCSPPPPPAFTNPPDFFVDSARDMT